MAKMSLKEKAIFTGIGIFLLYAATVGFWFLRSSDRTVARKRLKNEEAKVRLEKDTISKASYWQDRYEVVAERIRMKKSDKAKDTEWMRAIGDMADLNNIKIDEIKETKGEDEWSGEMERIIFDVKWTGAMESVVKFLYSLQNYDKGVLDVQTLAFAPLTKQQGFLKGSMTIVCMFMKDEEED